MSEKYDKYLKEHIGAVEKAARWMLDNLSIAHEMGDEEMLNLLTNVECHDMSKRVMEEYGPYDAYFYGTDAFSYGSHVEDAFNLAWLHHIHHNAHHWQYWLLMNDDGGPDDPKKLIPLEMPKIYAIEMIADWWSFSWRSGNLSEVFDWYAENRDNIILHERTREYVERVLDEMRETVGDDA